VHAQAVDGPPSESVRQDVYPPVTRHRAVTQHNRLQGAPVSVQQVFEEPDTDGIVVGPEPPQLSKPGVQELEVEVWGQRAFNVHHVQHADVHGAQFGKRVLVCLPDSDAVQH